MDFLKFLRLFLGLSYIDGGEGAGASATGGASDPQSTQTQAQAQQSQTTQAQEGQAQTQAQTQSSEEARIKELEEQVKRLRGESEQQRQTQEAQALIEQTRAEIKAIESSFPEWNESEQKRTVLEMQARQKALSEQGQSLGDRYKGTAGAFLFWKENLAGNPTPSGNASGYTPSESEKKLIEKAQEGAPLTKEERIKLLEISKQGV